jgi:hypothetical protein
MSLFVHGVSLLAGLSKFPGDIIFGPFISGMGKNLEGGSLFNQFPIQKESRPIGDPRGLLNVMGHQDDGIVFF